MSRQTGGLFLGAMLAAAFALESPRPALAQDADANALMLADTLAADTGKVRPWHAFAEAASGGDRLRSGTNQWLDRRLSLDLHYDQALTPAWRIEFADRLDMSWPAQTLAPIARGQTSVNTIKDAYASWQPSASAILDAGRINVREGVAMGYNPTDYFRVGAVRSIISVDPLSLKENRQGSVMLRGQTLWNGGSLTALVSPKLASAPDNGGWNPDLAATNGEDRWLLSISQRISEGISPQLLLFKSSGEPVQLGCNLTGLVGEATVIYAEWSGGRSPSELAQALGSTRGFASTAEAFHSHLAAGTTYTTANKLSLTLELQFDGGATDSSTLYALYRNAPLRYADFRLWLLNAREPLGRHATFLYAKWLDALRNHLDLSAMEVRNGEDRSRLSWLEARYHFQQFETALQWQAYSGDGASEYGAIPQAQTWQILLRAYF